MSQGGALPSQPHKNRRPALPKNGLKFVLGTLVGRAGSPGPTAKDSPPRGQGAGGQGLRACGSLFPPQFPANCASSPPAHGLASALPCVHGLVLGWTRLQGPSVKPAGSNDPTQTALGSDSLAEKVVLDF